MRLAVFTAAAAAVALLALGACNKGSAADAHLKEAGAEAKAAAQQLDKAVDASVPAIKDAGHRLGEDIRSAGDKAGRDLKDAGRKVKDSADD